MAQYIPKSALVAEIERRLHFDNNWIEGDKRWQKRTNGVSSAYYKAIGSKHACESILDFVNTLEVKEVDLEKEAELIANGIMIPIQSNKYNTNVYNTKKCDFNHYHLKLAARRGIEIGLSASNPITAKDRGTAEEIINNLKRVEQDYRIDLTKEIEWLRNKVKKGE